MADIFISYAREDRQRVEPLVRLLEEHGFSVWWDREIAPGEEFETIIDGAIRDARCVIVVWTAHSVVSDWVQAEAGDGMDRGILIPVMLESVRLPLAFRRRQAARLHGWPRRHDESEQQLLLDGVSALLTGKSQPSILGQRRPQPRVVWMQRAGIAAVALASVAAALVAFFWAPAAPEFKQVLLERPIGTDRSFMAQSLVHEIGASLRRYPNVLTVEADKAGRAASGYRLSTAVDGEVLRLTLFDGGGEKRMTGDYRLDDDIRQVAAGATRDVVTALGERFIQPVDARLEGRDFRLYLAAMGALRGPESSSGLLDALSQLNEIHDRNPRHAPTLVGLCKANLRLFVERGSTAYYEDAERFCHRAVTLGGGEGEGLLALGLLYIQSGLYEEAIESLLRVVERTPYDVEAVRALGEAYFKGGALDRASEQFRLATQLEPGYWANHKRLGDVLFAEGRYSEAVPHYWTVVGLVNNKSQPFSDLAAALFLSGEFEDAIEVWRQAVELDPLAITYSNLGSAYYFSGRYTDAAEMYEQAIALAPDDHLYWGHAAEAYLQTGARDAAEYFRRALALGLELREINTRDHVLLSRIATYYAALGDAVSARRVIDEARQLQSSDLDVLYDQAIVSARLGEMESARLTLADLTRRGYSQTLIDADANFASLGEDLNMGQGNK